jgi:putative RecB family exonuclease
MSTYSPSKLSVFETCPLRYKLSYIDRIKRDIDRIEYFLGSRVHEVLEKLYLDLKYKKVNSLDDLLGYYDELWKKNWHDDIKIAKETYTAENYYQIGVDCISSYHKRYQPFDQATVVGIEKNLSGIITGGHQIMGFADRIDQFPDGSYEIHDYKTSAHLPNQAALDEDRQLALYHLMLKNEWCDVKEVALVWHYLAFDKELRSFRTDEQLDELIGQTLETIRSIEKAEETGDFPAIESALCDWCDYPDLCPKRKHLVQVEALSVNEYLSDDGVKLVNEYAKWHGKQKEAKDELEKVKEAVLAYAKKQGLELIRGSDYKLRVKFSSKIKLPAKADKERQQLEKVLQDIGKLTEVSTLDTFKLAKIVQNEEWDKQLLEKIQDYYQREETSSVSLSKLKE